MANKVDSDQILHLAVSDLGLQCLLRLVCPDTKGKEGITVNVMLRVLIRSASLRRF